MRRSSLNHEPDSTLAVTKTCPKDGVHLSIPPGPYDFRDFFTSYSLGAQRRVSGTVTFQTGGFFSGDITAVGFRSGRIEITPQLSVEPGVSVNHVDLPEGVFTATVASGRVGRGALTAMYRYAVVNLPCWASG